ncbi:MAG: transporter substrate-binding protein, partial [Prochlorococcus sp.]
MNFSFSKRLAAGLAATAVGVSITACGGGGEKKSATKCDENGENCTVTVGILHSLSGTMAISESTLVDTEKMAIDEINAAGGVEVDGKKYKIDSITEDGASDWPTFAEKSKKLIDQDGVPVVF